ncbi:MFS transporter [Ornithinimicrobium faecis]|uniref:MFS transporter n=1 Tax=Ornithinimicrobium faecis TaxID=2934158 RepID=A0ABY4YS17_9MICO|nr:MFS transporter [Ornithinimicrobium sp. HY1793]USQ79382.1 MFS transporter [Ornithinimicrobium sp. HY1793]
MPSSPLLRAPHPSPARPRPRIHRAWWVALAGFIAMVGAAGFRSVPGVLIGPLHDEFGWSHGTIGVAVSINLVLYGLFSPFAAALMDRFGIRPVLTVALLLLATGGGLTVFMTEVWHLWLLWGLLVGVGAGSISMAFIATLVNRWFVARRGLVSGVLTAAGAAGQLIFLPAVAWLATNYGWRLPALFVAGTALLVLPLVIYAVRDHPHEIGLEAFGATEDEPTQARAPRTGNAATMALSSLFEAARTRTFWLLAGGFAVCGASTNGLVGTHFVPAAHDHGMPLTAAASLLAIVGVVDIIGTIGSGFLTDRIDPRILLAVYYTLRGLSLMALPALFGPDVQPSMWAFIIFYGLDWVATVPPTVALCQHHFGEKAPMVFGWVFASHQIGAAVAATGAGLIRDIHGSYDFAWLGAGALCLVATAFSLLIPRARQLTPQAVAAG